MGWNLSLTETETLKELMINPSSFNNKNQHYG